MTDMYYDASYDYDYYAYDVEPLVDETFEWKKGRWEMGGDFELACLNWCDNMRKYNKEQYDKNVAACELENGVCRLYWDQNGLSIIGGDGRSGACWVYG